jgi:OOP family OmpA-OmpF porin
MKRYAAALVAFGVLGLSTAPVRADTTTGFALDRFDPSERGSDWFSADSLDFRGQVRPAVGIVTAWAYKPLVLYNRDGSVNAPLVEDQLVLHPGATFVLWDRVRLGLDIPIAVVDTGDGGAAQGVTYAAPNGASIGDIRLGADVALVGHYDGAFALAAGTYVYLPTGSRGSFTGDGTVRAEPHVLAAGRVGRYFVYAARVGIDVRPLDSTFAGASLGSEFVFGAAVGVKAAKNRLVVGPELYGSTVITSGGFSTANTPVEAMLGAHYTFVDDFRIGAGVGPGLTRGFGAPELRAALAVEWAPAYHAPRPDADGDGVWDGEDACPTIPGVQTSDPRANGCPPDRDLDGVPDSEDACPWVAGVRTTDPRTNGCPSDADHDGVPDSEDACPTVAGVRTGDPKTNGCPPDRDGDGIPDAEDACPNVPGVKTGDPKTNGCPSDRDADGIPDTEDACPDQAGPRDPDPKKNGCPPAFVQGTEIKIRDPFKFRYNSIELDPAGDPILDAVLAFLKAHPELQRVRIEGHTDNVGGVEFNVNLSDGRAASVRKWLVAHGIEASRLTSHGYGQARPVDSNDTEQGRRNNRRVEFHIEETKP